MQSKELTQFYRDYKAWLDNGAIEVWHMGFSRLVGLCANIQSRSANSDIALALKAEMRLQFADAGLCSIYPFGGEDAFGLEYDNKTAYLNVERIKWVNDHVNP